MAASTFPEVIVIGKCRDKTEKSKYVEQKTDNDRKQYNYNDADGNSLVSEGEQAEESGKIFQLIWILQVVSVGFQWKESFQPVIFLLVRARWSVQLLFLSERPTKLNRKQVAAWPECVVHRLIGRWNDKCQNVSYAIPTELSKRRQLCMKESLLNSSSTIQDLADAPQRDQPSHFRLRC